MLEPNDLLSTNFRAYEFAQKVGQVETLPDDPAICFNIAHLAGEGLQPLRDAWARHLVENTMGGSAAIKIVCGWRSREHNAAVGGAPKSQHMTGLAADICCDVDWRALRRGLGTVRDAERMSLFASFAEKYIDKTDAIGGYGIYTNNPTQQCYWLHADMRPRVNGHVARWTGHHVGSEQ